MYKMNFGIILFELVILTTADLISWNRGWNGIYRFSKGKQFMEPSARSVDIPEYTRQLNSFLMKNHKSEAEKSKMMAELLEKLNTMNHIWRNMYKHREGFLSMLNGKGDSSVIQLLLRDFA